MKGRLQNLNPRLEEGGGGRRDNHGRGPLNSTRSFSSPEMSVPVAGGFRIILKNAKIYAESVIIKRE